MDCDTLVDSKVVMPSSILIFAAHWSQQFRHPSILMSLSITALRIHLLLQYTEKLLYATDSAQIIGKCGCVVTRMALILHLFHLDSFGKQVGLGCIDVLNNKASNPDAV